MMMHMLRHRLHKVEDGRPQETRAPRKGPPPTSTLPRPTMYGQNRHRRIVGTGLGWADVVLGVASCGRPSSNCHSSKAFEPC